MRGADPIQLAAVLDRDNTASDVWAGTAYRSAANMALLGRRGLKPQFQRKKLRGKKMPAHIARGNATRARVRSRVEHVFAPLGVTDVPIPATPSASGARCGSTRALDEAWRLGLVPLWGNAHQ